MDKATVEIDNGLINEPYTTRLALHGGAKVRQQPWPPRRVFGEEEKRAVMALFDKAIASGEAFNYDGEEEQAYCREFADFHGGGYADAVNSGTTAIYVALRALQIEPFTEVIVPPITDPGGVMPVPLINCVPIISDAAPGSFNAGPEQIEARITERTSAIIVAHIGGLSADMDPIMEVARARKVPVIEDCAQAHGAKHKGRLVGTIGDVGAFSTMSGKHHATGPQGGVVFTRSEELYWRARRLSDRGKPFGLRETWATPSCNVACSLNLNSNDLASCIGRVQLRKLPGVVERRRLFALAVADGCRSLRTVSVQTGLPHSEGVFWFLLLELNLEKLSVDKNTFVAALAAEGLPVNGEYLHVFTNSPWYKDRAVFGTSGYPWTSPLYRGDPEQEHPVPNAVAAHGRIFRLEMHENLTDAEVRDTLEALRKVEAAYLKI
jgi:dTDP-4-amino-4,6-dideoxygalactose transaminase